MTDTKKKALSFPLRLPLTMRAQLEARANSEGMSLNQFIVMAVAEKIIRFDKLQAPVPVPELILDKDTFTY